jgi:hypothetical protein
VVCAVAARPAHRSLAQDGLTAHDERTVKFDSRDFHRVARQLPFPKLAKRRGVFIVDLVGNGRHCRAVVRKGRIRLAERLTVQGTEGRARGPPPSGLSR